MKRLNNPIVPAAIVTCFLLSALPTISSSCWLAVKGGVMKREWHIPDIDYVELLGIRGIEAGDYGFPEYEADKIGAKIKQYIDSVRSRNCCRSYNHKIGR